MVVVDGNICVKNELNDGENTLTKGKNRSFHLCERTATSQTFETKRRMPASLESTNWRRIEPRSISNTSKTARMKKKKKL